MCHDGLNRHATLSHFDTLRKEDSVAVQGWTNGHKNFAEIRVSGWLSIWLFECWVNFVFCDREEFRLRGGKCFKDVRVLRIDLCKFTHDLELKKEKAALMRPQMVGVSGWTARAFGLGGLPLIFRV